MDSAQAPAPDGWEYMVIHLNVEPGPAAAPDAAQPAEAPPAEKETGPAKPVFSDSFLKKEFPQFYENRPAQERSGGQPQHPAQQLQTFLNGHGSQGWELIGLFPVGSLSMLFFRRPRRPPPPALPPAGAARAGAESAAPAGGPATAAETVREAALDAVLARLTALEQRLATAQPSGAQRRRRSAAVAGSASARSSSGADPSAPSALISRAQLRRLSGETAMPSSAAALAIGLRSAASLANHGARHGFQPGLCKHGPNGQVAVYVGTGSSDHGGKARRLWIVVGADRLEA